MKNNAALVSSTQKIKEAFLKFLQEKRKLSYEDYLLSSEDNETIKNYLEKRKTLKKNLHEENIPIGEIKQLTESLKQLELERTNIQKAIKYRTNFSQELNHTSFWHSLLDANILQEMSKKPLNGAEYKEYLALTTFFSKGKNARQDRTYTSPLLSKNAQSLFPCLYQNNISHIEKFISLKIAWQESGIGSYANYPIRIVMNKFDELTSMKEKSEEDGALKAEIEHEQLLLCGSLIQRLKTWPIHTDSLLSFTEEIPTYFGKNENGISQMNDQLVRNDLKIHDISRCMKYIIMCLPDSPSPSPHAKKIKFLKKQLENIPVWPKNSQGEPILHIPQDDKLTYLLSQAHAIWIAESQLKNINQELSQEDLRSLSPLKYIDIEGNIPWIKSQKTIVAYSRKALIQFKLIQKATEPERIAVLIVRYFPILKIWLYPYQTSLFKNLFSQAKAAVNEHIINQTEQSILLRERAIYRQILKDVQEVHKQLLSLPQDASDLQIQEQLDSLEHAERFIKRYQTAHPKETQNDNIQTDLIKALSISIENKTLTREYLESLICFMARGKISSYTPEQTYAVQILKALFFGHPGTLKQENLQKILQSLFQENTSNILQNILAQLQEQYFNQYSFLRTLLFSKKERELSSDEKKLYSDLFTRYHILTALGCSLLEPLKILPFKKIIINGFFSDINHLAWQQLSISCQLYKKYGGTQKLTDKLNNLKKQAIEIGLQFIQKNSIDELYNYDTVLTPLFTLDYSSQKREWTNPFASHILQLCINEHPLIKTGKATSSEIQKIREWIYTLQNHGGSEVFSAEYNYLEKILNTLFDKFLSVLESKNSLDLKSLLLFFEEKIDPENIYDHIPLIQTKIKSSLTKALYACHTREEFDELNAVIPPSLKNLLFEEGLQYYQQLSTQTTEPQIIKMLIKKLSAQDCKGHIYPKFMFDSAKKHKDKLKNNSIANSSSLFGNNSSTICSNSQGKIAKQTSIDNSI